LSIDPPLGVAILIEQTEREREREKRPDGFVQRSNLLTLTAVKGGLIPCLASYSNKIIYSSVSAPSCFHSKEREREKIGLITANELDKNLYPKQIWTPSHSFFLSFFLSIPLRRLPVKINQLQWNFYQITTGDVWLLLMNLIHVLTSTSSLLSYRA